MGFSSHSDRLIEAVMSHLSDTDEAIYSRFEKADVTIQVILDRDVERTIAGMQGVVMEARTELTGYSSDLSKGGRGDTVTIGDNTWRLSQKASDDGHLVTWIVTLERDL